MVQTISFPLFWNFVFYYTRQSLGRKERSSSHLNEGLPQGSDLAPLFNVYTVYPGDILVTKFWRFVYADPPEPSILKRLFYNLEAKAQFNVEEVASFYQDKWLYNHNLQVYVDGVKLNYNEHPQYLRQT